MQIQRLLAPALIAALVLAGCKKPEETAPVVTPDPTTQGTAPVVMPSEPMMDPMMTPPADPAAMSTFAVRSIDIGSAIGPDNRVTTAATTFRPSDTIFAAVASDGTAASVNVAAKWTFEDGQLVNEASQAIAPAGPAVTTFNISKPDGFPVGRYKVEVMVDGQPAGQSEFEVR